MRTTLNIPKELITSIDIMNTLNGGSSESVLDVKKFSTHHRIRLSVPGVTTDNIKIEINNNQLMIFYYTPIESQGQELRFPRVVYNKSIPYFVDAASINAVEEENALVVTLPFNGLESGYHRDIGISNL